MFLHKLSIPDICTILLFNTMEHFFLSKESANSHNTISGKNSFCIISKTSYNCFDPGKDSFLKSLLMVGSNFSTKIPPNERFMKRTEQIGPLRIPLGNVKWKMPRNWTYPKSSGFLLENMKEMIRNRSQFKKIHQH